MHEQWLAVAEDLGANCIDPYVKVGCVLVRGNEQISEGYNRVVTGVEKIEARHSHRPAMYFWVEHAERIAIYQAARHGASTEGATAYVNVSPESVCTLCLRALIEGGIIRIVGNTRQLNSKNSKSHAVVNRKMLDEAGIETVTINMPLKY